MMSTENDAVLSQVKAKVTYVDTMPGETRGYSLSADNWTHRLWKVVLRLDGRQMTTKFRTGLSLPKPKASDVLECLILDANGYDYSDGFEDWADNYGYDTDSRKAERTYHKVERQTAKLRQFLGDRYDEFTELEF